MGFYELTQQIKHAEVCPAQRYALSKVTDHQDKVICSYISTDLPDALPIPSHVKSRKLPWLALGRILHALT